jgi:hypothetical protein
MVQACMLSADSCTIYLSLKRQSFQVRFQPAYACRNALPLLLTCRWLVCPSLTMLTKLPGLRCCSLKNIHGLQLGHSQAA